MVSVRRRDLAWIAALLALPGCVDAATGSSRTPPGSIALNASTSGLGATFDLLAARREPPSVAELEHLLGASATTISRPDRNQEAAFLDGTRFVQTPPAPPDGRARLDTGPIAALRVPVDASGAACIALPDLQARLIGSGWLSPAPFGIERHGQGGASTPAPWMLSRHDHHLRLYLFPAGNGCLASYALLWNLELSGLMQIMPTF